MKEIVFSAIKVFQMEYMNILSRNLKKSIFSIILTNQKLDWWKIILIIASLVGWIVFFNLKIAIMAMIMIGFHEIGHVFAANYLEIPNSGFYYIPLLGGISIRSENS